jgi:hypothetical protein
MTNPVDPQICQACSANRALIEKLDERLTALETEVLGAPADALLGDFAARIAQANARQDAIDEYQRLRQEEFYRTMPGLKKAADEEDAKYEAFMRERGFEP